VVYANNYLLEFFGKSYEEIINRRACGVFGCINANEHEKGCGYGSKCPSCDLNNAITDTIKTGESLRDVEYNAAIDNQDEIKEISLMAYTSLIRTQKKLVSLIFVDVSERKKMETALRENEERYRKLYEETPVMLHSIDKKGRLISVSNTWLQKLGYTKDEVIGKKSIDFLTEESKHKALEVYLPEFFDKGFSKDASYQMVTKSGEVLDVLMSAVAENADSMGFVRSMAVIEDVTERKKAEQALRESEEMMRSSQSVAQICSYSTNLNEEDISKSVWVCSPEFYKIFGIEETYPHTIEGWANFIHPDYREEVFAYHASVVKEKKSFNREYKIIRINDGEERWVLGTGELVYDDQGKPIRMYGAIQDITERKIAEKALRESEERFRGLYENATIGIYRTTPDGQILMANPALVKMLEYSSFEELARRNLSDEGYEASYARSEFMRLIEENGKVYGLESAWRTKSGKVIYISESARLVSDGNGKLLYYEGTIEDITQRKKAVDALRASEERLSSILRAAPVGIGVVVNRVFTELNQTICNITGYNREELIGQSALMLYHSQEEYETVGREKYRQISEKGTGTVETVWRRKDGSLVNIILSSTPINPVDLSQGVTFTALDISERKKAEEELEQSQLLLQTISDNMFDLVALTDLTGHYSFVGASYSYLGYNPSDLLGINMMFHVHPDDLPEVLQTFKEFSESKVDGTRAEYRFCCSDGSYVWVETVGRYLYDDKGKPKSILLNSRNIDERKKIEEALRLSENQYRLLFENMTQGFALHEIISDENDKPYDYRYLSINPAFEKLTGLKAQDLIGKTILEVMPNTEKYWIDNYGKVAQTREPIRYENYAKELGKYYDVSAFCPQKDFFAVVFSDITERKKAEEKVLKLTKGIDQSPATVVITDIDGNIEFVNPRFTEVTGFTAQEAMGQNPRVLKSDYQTKEFYKDLWDTIKSGNDWRGELCNKKKSGELYWESASISPIKNEFGEIVNFIAVKEDITDRKNAILALEQNNRLINTMLDNLPVGIFMVDALNGKPIIANEYAKKLLGKGIVKDASTETLSEVYQAFKVGTNQFYPTSEMPIVKGIRGIPSHIDDMEVLQPDGRKILLEVFGCPVFNSQGQIWASLVGFLDITERKRTEITLRENQLVLKEKNEEYLALNEELTESNERINRINTDLVLARQKAEESDQLKSAFLANMSHEIRTPMNAIIGFSEMLLNPRIPSEKKDFFAHILNSACHQLLNIVEDIIDISKIETGQMDIHIGKSNINQIVNRIQQIYYPQTSENGVDILAKCQLNDDMAEINTDSTKLSQILTNLVSNAVKFTEKGAIEIGYVVKAEVIEFYVKDSGVGIASEHFELIFERFRQVDLGDTRKYGGTGLGLPICKAFIEMLGGRIWLESELGKGSIFKFTLPYKPVNEVSDYKKSKKKTFDFSGKTILIAEDQDTNYLYISEIIAETGASILKATNGQEAVDLYLENPAIDIILMDIKMPIINGIEATKMIRGFNRDLPIIALTAYAMSGDKEKCMEAGCNAYISKPIIKDDLLSVIDRYIRK
jgi:PAS domain S-box-containing protein